MRHAIRLTITAALSVFLVGATVASAQEAGPTYTSSTSTLSFTAPAGWEPQAAPDLGSAWIEAAQATFPADGRVLTVAVQTLAGETAVDEAFKALIDADASAIGQLTSSDIIQIDALNSANGKWTGVFQTYLVQSGDVTLEVARFMVPIGTQNYAIAVVGGPGTLSASSSDVGFVAASLRP